MDSDYNPFDPLIDGTGGLASFQMSQTASRRPYRGAIGGRSAAWDVDDPLLQGGDSEGRGKDRKFRRGRTGSRRGKKEGRDGSSSSRSDVMSDGDDSPEKYREAQHLPPGKLEDFMPYITKRYVSRKGSGGRDVRKENSERVARNDLVCEGHTIPIVTSVPVGDERFKVRSYSDDDDDDNDRAKRRSCKRGTRRRKGGEEGKSSSEDEDDWDYRGGTTEEDSVSSEKSNSSDEGRRRK